MKRLILNADDMGISVPTNLAIERAFRQGALGSASLMANMGAARHACQEVLRRNPALGVGLHLCLTSGRPVLSSAEVPLLAGKNGLFRHGFFGLLRLVHSARRAEALKQIADEWAAQAQRLDNLGVRIDHLDSHQHVHIIPGIFAVAARMAERRGIAIRISDERFSWSGRAGRRLGDAIARGGLAKKLILSRFAAANRRDGLAPRSADHYYGVVHTGRMNLARLLEIVRRLPEGTTEISLHPGTGIWSGAAEECSREDRKFLNHPDRAAEFDALLSPIFRDELTDQKIELARFRDVFSPRDRLRAA
jgi:chitin disaccharide deacetylase